jgi:5-hydroxyisourate hydrolase
VTEITTHVLDTAIGRPAAGVPVSLHHRVSSGPWSEVGTGITDSDGRATGLGEAAPGVCCLVFDTASYQEEHAAFFDDVTVTFRVEPGDDHLHVPLLLSPYGYSVYKGS